jgi:hypothetical protein
MSLLFRLRHWRRIRSLKIERRKILKSFAPAEFLIEPDSSEELSKWRENIETLETIDKSLLLLEWLEYRSEAAGLGIFVDWSEEKADELFKNKELDTFRKEISEFRLAIRNERNERWKFWELRLKVVTALAVALTGAIGAAIGLVATLRK